MNPTRRDPQAEAEELVGPGLRARVLEPSPPAVSEGPFFADDPVDAGGGGGDVLVPAGMPDGRGWDAWLAEHPEQDAWIRSRWLAGDRRLPDVPESLVATRLALHRLAVYVIAPIRHRANGKFGLRWTLGGFGTPFFGDDRQVRVVDGVLVDQRGDTVVAAAITSLQAASEFLDAEIDAETAAEHDSPAVGDVDVDLGVDVEASSFLGTWFGMAFAALERVRADPASVDPSRPQLWPGHFDPAIEVGDEDHRASYGASPGDSGVAEPYLYVSAWWPDRLGLADEATRDGDFWNAPSFVGRVLRVSDMPTDRDIVDVATDFWTTTRDALAARSG